MVATEAVQVARSQPLETLGKHTTGRVRIFLKIRGTGEELMRGYGMEKKQRTMAIVGPPT